MRRLEQSFLNLETWTIFKMDANLINLFDGALREWTRILMRTHDDFARCCFDQCDQRLHESATMWLKNKTRVWISVDLTWKFLRTCNLSWGLSQLLQKCCLNHERALISRRHRWQDVREAPLWYHGYEISLYRYAHYILVQMHLCDCS